MRAHYNRNIMWSLVHNLFSQEFMCTTRPTHIIESTVKVA